MLKISFEVVDLEKVKRNDYDLRLNQYIKHNHNIETLQLRDFISLQKGKNPEFFSEISNDFPYLNIDYFEEKSIKYVSKFDKMLIAKKEDILIVADDQRSGLYF